MISQLLHQRQGNKIVISFFCVNRMLVFTQTQEDSATPPSDNKPSDSAEFVPPTRRPSVFSQLSSFVPGMSPLGSSPAPQASDSETKDLIPSTSEPNDSMEVNCIHYCSHIANFLVCTSYMSLDWDTHCALLLNYNI